MAQMTAQMAALRAGPPIDIGGRPVVEAVDLIDGTSDLAPSNVLIYHIDGGRLIIRPSGTEPKIKAYLESVAIDQAAAGERLAALTEAVPALLAPGNSGSDPGHP
jgi:phosphomannomutase